MTNSKQRRYRVALVEDSNEDAFLIREASRKVPRAIEFVRFATAESAITGLTGPDSQPLDGIIIDLNLPRGSGLDVLEAVRRSPIFRNSPVVVMTSSKSTRDKVAAQALDIQAYIEKPTKLEEFESAVAEALEKLLSAGENGHTT